MRSLSLRTWWTLLLLILVSSMFVLVGGSVLLYRLPLVEQRVRALLEERVQSSMHQLEQFTRVVEDQLRSFAEASSQLDVSGQQRLAQALARHSHLFNAIYVLDGEHRVEVLALPDEQGRPLLDQLRGTDLSANPLVAALHAPRPDARAALVWSDEYLSVLSGRNTVALGIASQGRSYILELSAQQLLTSISRRGQSSPVDFELLVVDQRGRQLASLSSVAEHQLLRDFSGSPSFQAALVGQPLPDKEAGADGSERSYAGQRSAKLGWVLMASSPRGMAEYSYRVTVLLVLAGLIAGPLLALVAAPLAAAAMARPLTRLQRRVRAIAAGQHEPTATEHSSITELQQLSEDIGLMVAQLQSREADARRAAERLSATLESTPSVAIQWFDRDGRILYWNEASTRMYGFNAIEAVGYSIHERPLFLRDEAQVQTLASVIAGVVETGKPFGPGEFPLRHKDGRDLVVLASLFAIPAEDGSRLVVCMDVDVSEHRQALDALAASENKLGLIFNASPSALWVSAPDEDGVFRFTAVNNAWEQLFKRPREQVLGKGAVELGWWVHDAERRQMLEHVRTQPGLHTRVAELRDGEGQARLCHISAQTVSVAGSVLLLAAAEDITEQRRAEDRVRQLNLELEDRVAERTEALSAANAELAANLEALRQAQQQLVQAEKLSALGRLVAGVAHELNTPLGNSLMAISSLREPMAQLRSAMTGGGLKRSMLESFVSHVSEGTDIAQRNLSRAAELVTSFKQVAVDQTTTQRRRFKLDAALEEIVLTLNPMLKRSTHKLSLDIATGIELEGYPGPLAQVITNLVQNALLHAFEGRDGDGLITIRARLLADRPGQVQLEVGDNGTGIAPEAMSRIFDPFYTTRMGRGGTGLGLHIVHNLVTQIMGGQIRVHSQAGHGTVFELLLPLEAPSCGADAIASA